MRALAEFKMLARSQPLTHMEAGASLVPRYVARDTSDQYCLSARSATADTKCKTIFTSSVNAPSAATDQRELLIEQCHRVLRFVLFGIMFYLYRMHVVHLGRITDRLASQDCR